MRITIEWGRRGDPHSSSELGAADAEPGSPRPVAELPPPAELTPEQHNRALDRGRRDAWEALFSTLLMSALVGALAPTLWMGGDGFERYGEAFSRVRDELAAGEAAGLLAVLAAVGIAATVALGAARSRIGRIEDGQNLPTDPEALREFVASERALGVGFVAVMASRRSPGYLWRPSRRRSRGRSRRLSSPPLSPRSSGSRAPATSC